MLLTGVILLGIIVAGVHIFWEEIHGWLKRCINKLKEILGEEYEVRGSNVFIKNMKEMNKFKQMSKNYSQDIVGRWKETIISKEINKEEIPDELIVKVVNEDEVDITDDLEGKLELNT